MIFSGLILAQDEPFTDKTKFEADLKKTLAATKNCAIIKQCDSFFAADYTNALVDDINKQKLTEIAKKILEKGLTPNPAFVQMMTMISAALNSPDINPELFLHYLDVWYKTLDLADNATYQSFVQVSTLFWKKRAVYDYYNNSCYIIGGTFDFDYKGVFQLPDNSANAETENQDLIPTGTEPDPFAEVKPDAAATEQVLTGTPMPSIEGPVIVFKDINIRLGSRNDTAIIAQTGGDFMFGNRLFVGSKGKMDWSIIDKNLEEIHVLFNEYFFNTTNNQLLIENATFNYPSKLETPITGVYEFISVPRSRRLATPYPRFTSNTNNVSLKNLGRNVNYIGGYCLSGNQFSSKCIDEKPASLIYSDGRNRFTTFSKQYVWSDSVVSSDPTAVLIYLDRDTLWHPGLRFTLNTSSQMAIFHRDKGVFKNSLFYDSYHGMEFSVDMIKWDLTTDSMMLDIYAAKSQIPAMFKSKEFFREKDFTNIQSLNNFHPIRLLFAHKKATESDNLSAGEIVTKYKITPAAFFGAMHDLERKGFVFFDEGTGTITLRPKAYHYMQAYSGKADFDGLYIPSLSPNQINATINMSDFSMRIRGVEKFFISDSANVYALPSNKTVTVFGNREIVYDGVLMAGLYHMRGKNFRFNYEDFLITLEQIDTIKFIKQDKKKGAKQEADSKVQFMDNQLLQSSGTIYINDPKNKSGRKKLPQYPKFDAKSGAYVYFNKKEILGGAYSRQVYFKVPPFQTDSVKSSDKSALKFKGTFFSGGIFPDFEETLTIMPDNALGFKHKTPAEGYPVYGGKGTFVGNLKLDNQGIRGDGELRYQSSIFYSNDFVFYQDSVIGIGQQAKIKELVSDNVYYPEVDISDYEMKWVQRDDSLHLINLKDPFVLYKKKVTLEGSLNVTPKGLFGSGMMEIRKVNVIASMYEFRKQDIEARHAVFSIKSPGNQQASLVSNNTKCQFNLNESYADISPEVKGLASLEFPFAQFKTSIENARWDMNKKVVTMQADMEHIENSYFYATNPEKDSLAFIGSEAVFDITTNLLKVSGVPYIKVADCKIIPDSNKVTVFEGAQLKSLKNALLRVDTLNGYHTLDKGKIEIHSRNKFTGSAIYTYVNARSDTFKIKFENFKLENVPISKRETRLQTVAEGKIPPEVPFYIGPKILYKGKAYLKANNPLLAFKGLVKIDLQSKGLKTDWFPYENDGKSKEIVIMLTKKPKSKTELPESGLSAMDSTEAEMTQPEEANAEEEEIGKLYTGIFYEMGTNEIYPTLVSTKMNDADEEIFATTGQLLFDQATNAFVVGDPKRISKEILAGNLYAYNDSSVSFTSSGKYVLAASDKNVEIATVGQMDGHLKHKNFAAHVMLTLKLAMPPKALELMAKKILEIYENKEPDRDSAEQHTHEKMLNKIAQIESEKSARAFERNYLETADHKPLFNFVPKLKEGICIKDVHLNWSHAHKAWHNYAHIDLSNIIGVDLNRRVKAFVEIRKSDQGDIITLFIHPRSDIWYYISYQTGRLALLSSEPEFTKVIAEKSKGETGTPLIYTFVQPDPTEKQQYLKDFWKNYLGKEYNEEEEEKEIEELSDMQAEQLQETLDQGPVTGEEDPNAPTKKESNKKKKKTDATATPVTTDENAVPTETAPAAEGEPVLAEPAPTKKSTKKSKKKTDPTAEPPVSEEANTPTSEPQLTPAETPASEPTETPAPVEKKKKEKKKKAEAPVETPPAEEPTAPAEATPAETPSQEPTETPAPVEKKKKEKKKKADATEAPVPTDENIAPTETAPAETPSTEPTETTAPVEKKKKEKKKKAEAPVETPAETPSSTEETTPTDSNTENPQTEDATDSKKKKKKDKKKKSDAPAEPTEPETKPE